MSGAVENQHPYNHVYKFVFMYASMSLMFKFVNG